VAATKTAAFPPLGPELLHPLALTVLFQVRWMGIPAAPMIGSVCSRGGRFRVGLVGRGQGAAGGQYW